MLRISHNLSIPPSELKITFIRASGPGGQNVNKVATAVLLRFNVLQSSVLSEEVRLRLQKMLGDRITTEGDLLIKAMQFRTQERNKQDALNRLKEIVLRALVVPKKRKKTKPHRGAVEERLKKKKLRGEAKRRRKSNHSD